MKLNQVMEGEHDPSQSSHGVGSRPTRPYMLSVLEGHFRYVYCPTTQPNHYQFPLDWEKASLAPLTRAIFVCSRKTLHNPLLVKGLPLVQTLHEQA